MSDTALKFTPMPFRTAFEARLQDLRMLRDALKSPAAKSIRISRPPHTLHDHARGKSTEGVICLESQVGPDGARVYGVPIVELTSLSMIECFPLLYLGERLPPGELTKLLDEAHETALRRQCYRIAQQVLRRYPADTSLMPVLTEVISQLPLDGPGIEPYESCLAWIATSVYLFACLYRMKNRDYLPEPPETLQPGLEEAFLRLRGVEPENHDAALKFVRTYCTMLCAHGANSSWLAAHFAACAGGGFREVLLAGLTVLATPRHGWAMEHVIGMLSDLKSFLGLSPGQVPSYEQLLEFAMYRRRHGQRIDGIGHLIYKQPDPRAIKLWEECKDLPQVAASADLQLLRAIQDLWPQVLRDPKVNSSGHSDVNVCVNIEYYAGPMQRVLLDVVYDAALPLLFAWTRSFDFLVARLHARALDLGLVQANSIDEQQLRELLSPSTG